ncbi:MAG: TetR family transcriptional regulator [Aeromicrobium sp.]|nr:TetR family transcriptional regulator [Aeromicrobium sp.]
MSPSQRDARAPAAPRSDAEGAAAIRVAQRRAARRANNRTDILDSAERVFAEFGVTGGSIRKIGADSGFSAPAIYTFFKNKQQLLEETIVRRAEELVQDIRAVAETRPEPLDGLHQVIDATIVFFEAHPDFGQLLRHVREGAQVAGPALSEFEENDLAHFIETREIIAGFIRAGQDEGRIRSGDAYALANLYEVLINEFVAGQDANGMSREQFHDFVGGAFGLPQG